MGVKESTLDLEYPLFVHPKVSNRLAVGWKLVARYGAKFWLLMLMAITAVCASLSCKIGCPTCRHSEAVTIRQAIVGVRMPASLGSVTLKYFAPNSRRSIFGDGRRSFQERNCSSNVFICFMRFSFHAGPEFLQTVTITSRRRVR